MPERPSARVLVAVALVTGCTLALQVLLTRLLSAVLAYHFSFLAISLALLGTGAGALIVYVMPERFGRVPLERQLSRWCGCFGVLLLVLPFLLIRLNFSGGGGVGNDSLTGGFVVNIALACVIAAAPSFVAGIVVALAISGYPQWIGRVYAFDLVGAGVGALVVVPLLWLSDAPTLLLGLGVVAFFAAVLFAPPTGRERFAAIGLTAVGSGLVIAATITSIVFLPPRFPLPDNARTVSDRWNPLSRVIAYELPAAPFEAVFYDRDYAPAPKAAGRIPDWRELRTGPQSIGYELTGPGRSLIIGGGGGRDIYNALSSGQARVDVIEINDGIRKAVDEDLRHLTGSPYSRPGVHTSIGDGRSILSRRDTQYDTVHIGFTNTLSGNSAAGYVLTENNLYTVEAFEEYLDHLKPDGILNVSRVRKLAGDEAVRLTVLVLAALERKGVAAPEQSVVTILGRDIFGEAYGTVLARTRPFTQAELGTIKRLAVERGQGVVFAPGGPYVDEWEELAEADDWRAFCSNYRLNVCPATDDKPFFFNQTRLSQIGSSSRYYDYSRDPYEILMVTLGVLMALSVLAFLLPLRLSRRAARPTVGSLSYFAALGFGFLMLEIVLIQRFVLFLGFPTYALSVVLFALLVFTGVGSSISSRFQDARRPLLAALSAVIVLTVAGAFGLQPLLQSLIEVPFPMRVAISTALLAPLGIVLGMAMPIGLRRFRALHPESIAYAWGVNGVASVVASVLGVALAINFGFATTSLVAGTFYLAALAHAALGRWPEPRTGTAESLAALP